MSTTAKSKSKVTVPDKDLSLGRLCISLHRARLVMARQRQIIVDMVRDFAGPYWGAGESSQVKEQPVNLLGLYVSVISRSLIAHNPRVMISTFEQGLKAVVAAQEKDANREIQKMDLARVLKRCVLNALFGVGIAKVALAGPGDAALGAWRVNPGQPYVENIDFDDFVYDQHARDMSYAGFMGHRIRVPREEVVNSGLYGKKADFPSASEDRLYNMEGDERISVLGRGMYGDNEEYEDFIDLWEIYLPRKKVVVTLADDYVGGAATMTAGNYAARALRVQKWIGPPNGPYHFLSYITVPGNALAKGPCQDLYDLHNAVNNIFRKLIRQAKRQKENTFYPRSNAEDADRIQKSSDGGLVPVESPDKIVKVEMGGPNSQNFMLGNELINRMTWLGGNIDTLGGLSPQAKTARQEMMMSQNSGGLVSDMQDTTVTFTTSIVTSLIWFWHYHPQHVMQVAHHLGEKGLPEILTTLHVGPGNLPQHPVTGQRWSPEDGVGFDMTRDHDFEIMDCKVDPYSIQHQTPAQRIAGLQQIITTIVMPLMPILRQQNLTFDLPAYLDKLAKYMDQPDLPEIIKYDESQPQMGQGQQGSPGGPGGAGGPGGPGNQGEQQAPIMPAPQQTVHIRENMPGRTQQGDQLNLRNALMGVDPGGGPSKPPGLGGGMPQ